MKRVELLAPAGNFDSAIAAFENGADAVYCGLQEFSARKGARNFTLDQISRLRSRTLKASGRIYVTINTILKENELPRLLTYLSRLEEICVDSVILQDPGLARIIKNHFPGIVMHGSTQMAVHNLSGLKILREMGFSRVVLPREMTLNEISGFKKALSDLELEVFIHGAQCYGFSGMCLASGMLLNRSANRGECGQICRTWFESRGDRGYYLSSTDLWAGHHVLELEKAGVSSLKIEGRMKSPAYAAAVSRYYRAVLDGEPADTLKTLEEELRIAFSRNSGPGHLASARGVDMVDKKFPGHRGLFLGKSLGGSGSQVQLDTSVTLYRRDGMMYLDSSGKDHSFSLDIKGASSLKPGRVSIPVPGKAPPSGTAFYKIQSHDNHMKSENEMAYPLYKKPVPCRITLFPDSLEMDIEEYGIHWSGPILSETARGDGNLEGKIITEFGKSPDCSFTLQTRSLTGVGLNISERFIPPSVLKKFRQEMYRELSNLFGNREIERLQRINDCLKEEAGVLGRRKRNLPGRAVLNPVHGQIPFLTPGNLRGADPVKIAGRKYFPLSPIVFPVDEETYREDLSEKLQDADELVGINNWGHIHMYRSLKKEHPSLEWFGDTGMLLANSQAVLMLEELTGEECAGAYGWIESEEIPETLTPPGGDFSPPLFISRNCFRRHSLGESCRNCARSFEYTMNQKDRAFKVIVQDCVTWIFTAEESGLEHHISE